MIKKLFTLVIVLAFYAYPQLVGPKISVQQPDHDFGDIKEGEVVSHTYVITNNGGDLLKIIDVRPSCGCTAATPDKRELKPGESTNISISFNSKGRKGPQIKTINVKSNDPEKPDVTLSLKCNVIEQEKKEPTGGAKIYFPETQHDFGKVDEGKVIDYTFKFQNSGTDTLLIKDVKTSCGCTAAIVSEKSLKPGQEGSIKVDFNTKNYDGRVTKSITVVTNDVKEPNKILTIFAEVQKN